MYGYLDAALHVKLSLGADAVMAGVSERYSGPVALAYLCTPVSPPPPCTRPTFPRSCFAVRGGLQ